MEFLDVAALLVAVALTLSPIYVIYQQQQREKLPWKRLAVSNNLTYTPGKFLRRGGLVTGIYRGHHLKLETTKKGLDKGDIYTLIMLTVNQTVNKRGFAGKDPVEIFTAEYGLRGRISTERNWEVVYYEQPGIENNGKYLQEVFDLLSNMADAYPMVIALGGEIVPTLETIVADKDDELRPIVIELLEEIGRDTTNRLEDRVSHLLCLRCLHRFQLHKVQSLSWLNEITYCGCRACHQSQDFFEGKVVVVLDNELTITQHQENQFLCINWFESRSLFDFDAVHIVQATDEDVERFAVQIGNDTEPVRKLKYKQLYCTVSADCNLSENTLRILKRMFGQIEIKKLIQTKMAIPTEKAP